MSGELPERARAWVLSRVAGATAVRGDSRLAGGLSADTRLLVVERGRDPSLEVVLKRFVEQSKGSRVAWEAETLDVLAGAALPYEVAQVLGRDDSGAECDVPALLTSRLPGRIAIGRQSWEKRVEALGEALAAFHALRLRCPDSLPAYMEESRRDKPVPDDASLPDWEAVWRFTDANDFGGDELLHGDYHLGNALFEEEHLTGIVDWASARRGAHDVEVAYCRVDLAMLFGEDAPERFLDAYERRARRRIENVSRWDLAASLRVPGSGIVAPGVARRRAGRPHPTAHSRSAAGVRTKSPAPGLTFEAAVTALFSPRPSSS